MRSLHPDYIADRESSNSPRRRGSVRQIMVEVRECREKIEEDKRKGPQPKLRA